ncbi:MAG TPA: 4Fe-4S dicluster domain-containing protein [Polyangia bacterium]|nr:4Fe-4S dicluster domain-containing protein [Polyangia bacterium]
MWRGRSAPPIADQADENTPTRIGFRPQGSEGNDEPTVVARTPQPVVHGPVVVRRPSNTPPRTLPPPLPRSDLEPRPTESRRSPLPQQHPPGPAPARADSRRSPLPPEYPLDPEPTPAWPDSRTSPLPIPDSRRSDSHRSPLPSRADGSGRTSLSGLLTARSLLRVVKGEGRSPSTAHSRSSLRAAPSEDDATYRELRTFAMFDGLPNEVLLEAIAVGEIELLQVERDDIFIDASTLPHQRSRVFFVLGGQLAVAVFAPGKLDELRAIPEKKKRKKAIQEPTIRLAEKNLATFGSGDLFGTQVLPEHDLRRAGIYGVQPTRVLSFDKSRLADIMRAFPFFQARIRRAADVTRERLAAIDGIKLEVVDFFVRHGLSVADTLRVRQIDRCIECKACEIACQERYGYKRLSLGGPRLGMLDFVQTCRTCVDRRCLEGCSYDAIRYDEERGEIKITEERCAGTGVCAALCPYGAIEMVEVSHASPLFLLRMKDLGAFNTRKPRVRKLASKCDHCADYGDQACVSHCPTGALIEISPGEIFRDGSAIAALAAQAGYDHTVHLDIDKLLPTDHFQKGLHITTGAHAKLPERKVRPRLYWSAALLGWIFCALEILLRRFAPGATVGYLYNRLVEGMDPELARSAVDYKAGCELAVKCGFIGTGLMLMTMGYVIRKHWKALQRFGTSQSWFDFHLMCGLMGPLFILLHTALRLDNWVSLAFWSMVCVVVSGLTGRYLFTQLPKAGHGNDLEQLGHERKLAGLREHSARAVAVVDDEIADFIETVRKVEQRGLVGSLLFVLADDLGRPLRGLIRLLRVHGRAPSWKIAREIAGRAASLRLLERRRVVMSRTTELLSAWKKVHVPFTIVMGILVTIHVVLAFKYSL